MSRFPVLLLSLGFPALLPAEQLDPKDLLGEWKSTFSMPSEEGITWAGSEHKIIFKDGRYFSEGFGCMTLDETGSRLLSAGGPDKGKWAIKGNKVHFNPVEVQIEFLSSLVPELHAHVESDDFKKTLREPTILELISKSTDKLVFRDLDDDSEVVYTRPPKPPKGAPSYTKPLASFTIEELGGDPTAVHPKKDDPAGERFRRQSILILKHEGFKAAKNLPTFKNRVGIKGQLRSKAEILDRLLCNYIAASWIFVPEEQLPTANIKAFLKQYQLSKLLTEKEQEILKTERTQALAKFESSFGWKLENMWALAWTLGFKYSPDIDQAQVGEEMIGDIWKFITEISKDRSTFLKESKMRSLSEIAQLEDLFYCAHNAVRSAQTGKQTVPKGFHPVRDGGVVHEKRHSLTWVLSPGVAWKDTDLST